MDNTAHPRHTVPGKSKRQTEGTKRVKKNGKGQQIMVLKKVHIKTNKGVIKYQSKNGQYKWQGDK